MPCELLACTRNSNSADAVAAFGDGDDVAAVAGIDDIDAAAVGSSVGDPCFVGSGVTDDEVADGGNLWAEETFHSRHCGFESRRNHLLERSRWYCYLSPIDRFRDHVAACGWLTKRARRGCNRRRLALR